MTVQQSTRLAHADLLTTDEAAERLRIGRSTAYRLVEAGHLRRVKIGRRAFITAASVDAYVDQLVSGPSDAA